MTITQEIIKELTNNNLVIFTGAGISVSQPAGFPVAFDISERILKTLFSFSKSPLPEKDLREIINQTQMERIWESVDRASNSGVLETIPLLEKGKPNQDHYFIIEVAKRYSLKKIFTLNFDTYLEKAFLLSNSTSMILTETSSSYISKMIDKEMGTELEIVHLHGKNDSGDISSLAATISSTGSRLSKDKEKNFVASIAGKSILCLGYSDGDYDTFPLIQTHCNKVYWYNYSQSLPSKITDLFNDQSEKYIEINDENGVGVSTFLEDIITDSIWRNLIKERVNCEKEVSKLELLDFFKKSFVECLGKNDYEKRITSLVALETLFFDIKRRNKDFGKFENSIQKEIKTLFFPKEYYAYYTHNLILSSCAQERKQFLRSLVYSIRAYQYSRDDYTLLAVIEKLIILWKILPIPLLFILPWCKFKIMSIIKRDEDHSVQKGYYLIGDVNQFLAEIFLFPSSDAIYRKLGKYVYKHSKIFHFLDRLYLFVFGSLRRRLLAKANDAYRNAALFPYSSPDRKENIAYNLLSALRSVETSAALFLTENSSTINTLVENAGLFYEQQQENNGVANCITSYGIREYYSGNRSSAVKALRKAYSLYEESSSGKSKTSAFLFRLCG